MSNGIVDNLLQGGTPPIFGPGPEPDLPNPRDIPEIIIKDQAAQQLGNIFDNAGITMINPSMVVDLADAVIDDELSLGDNSGNNNLGVFISDYRNEFDKLTKQPIKSTDVNNQKIEFRKRRAF